MDKADLSDFPSLKVLIIDESTLVHNMLTASLNDFGISYIRCAENAYYALRLAEQTQFHIVICAFNVNSDKDGFHLLEELKFKGHINKRTVLIFLSADTQASLVNSIVELQPDDFWVKPLAHKQVQTRLNYTLAIKQTLYNVYQAIDQKEYSKVIYSVERHLLNPKLAKYHLPLMRLKGEAYLSLLEFTEAQTFFQTLLEKHPLSWVYLGYVKSLLKQNKMLEITQLLETLIDKPDTRFATYDLLAQFYIEQENYKKAYIEIQKAAELAPRNIERNKKLWDLARLNHDHQGQYKATQAMAKYAKNSIHDSPELNLNVIRSGIDLACTLTQDASVKVLQQVDRQIKSLEQSHHDLSTYKQQLTISKIRLHNAKAESNLAERLLDAHVSLKSHPSIEDNLDKVKAFHELGRREEAVLLLDAIKKQISGDNLTSQVVGRYIEQETEERTQVHFTPKQLSEMANELFKRKKYAPALNTLEQAFKLAPNNVRTALSMIKIIIIMSKQDELMDEQKESLQSVIEQIEQMTLTENQAVTYQALMKEFDFH